MTARRKRSAGVKNVSLLQLVYERRSGWTRTSRTLGKTVSPCQSMKYSARLTKRLIRPDTTSALKTWRSFDAWRPTHRVRDARHVTGKEEHRLRRVRGAHGQAPGAMPGRIFTQHHTSPKLLPLDIREALGLLAEKKNVYYADFHPRRYCANRS